MTNLTATAPRPARKARGEWRLPALLLGLLAIPVAAGAFRITMLVGGGEVTPENQRFFDSPVPVVLHIVAVTIYGGVGAFQFVPSLRRRRPGWHRRAGRVLVVAGLVTALTGLWMTLFYELPEADQGVLSLVRYAVGSAIVLFLGLGFAAIRRRDVASHRAWMIRAYALAMGAATQVLTLGIPLIVTLGAEPGKLGRLVGMSAGWLVNIAIAEWAIRRQPARRARRPRTLEPAPASP
jgi:uncharacterized membrane protein YozB (DUF420 family)